MAVLFQQNRLALMSKDLIQAGFQSLSQTEIGVRINPPQVAGPYHRGLSLLTRLLAKLFLAPVLGPVRHEPYPLWPLSLQKGKQSPGQRRAAVKKDGHGRRHGENASITNNTPALFSGNPSGFPKAMGAPNVRYKFRTPPNAVL